MNQETDDVDGDVTDAAAAAADDEDEDDDDGGNSLDRDRPRRARTSDPCINTVQ